MSSFIPKDVSDNTNNIKIIDNTNVDKQNTANNWTTQRKYEYYSLTEKESDEIPLNVYQHILKYDTPWISFRDYLLEDDEIKQKKMLSFRLLRKETEDEWIIHPITGEYYNKTELYNNLEYYRENNYDSFEIEYESSDCYWEDEYENYESSDEEEYYDDYFTDEDDYDY